LICIHSRRILMHLKRAFTLIELLVVIAIIAILAAILFPVFAQAKAAAKGTASLSNAKQESLGMFMYSADADDMQVLHAVVNDPTSPADGHRPWTVLLAPYMKNTNILQDPLSSQFIGYGTGPSTINDQYAPRYAYIYQIHSPVVYYGGGVTGLVSTPQSQTSLAQPANTVLLVADRNIADGGTWWWYGAGWGFSDTYDAGSPFCSGGYYQNPLSLCPAGYASWGVGSISGWTTTDVTLGGLTAGVAFRKAGRGIVAWADGHTSTQAPGQLAAGTNWTPTINQSAVVINDATKYVWDNQ
jgi:prepilin-type N-terminal cleavage/methylation domain-containing protein/prepilin-type processing-associated H-X9-DG protein